jgi:predicted transcriptional regulator
MLPSFKRVREAVTAELGELEREVMRLAWRGGEVSVREVHLSLDEGKAYTTVMTTLDRLFRKGLLTRRKSGRAYLYSPRMTREEFERIVDAVSDRDRELLDELDRLVRQKKQELEQEESK